MELKDYALALWKWRWLILLATVMAGGMSYWTTSQMPFQYQTTTTLRVGQFLENPDPRGWDFNTSQQLAQSYAQAAQRQTILKATVDALGLEWPWQLLARNVTVVVVGSQYLQIGVVDADPARAKAIADEIARQVILQSPTAQEEQAQAKEREFVANQLSDLQGKIEGGQSKIGELEHQVEQEASAVGIKNLQDQIAALHQQVNGWQATYATLLQSNKGTTTNFLSVFDPASLPTRPSGPNLWRNVLIAALVGFVLAATAALFMEYFDDTIRSSNELERLIALPLLGAIARLGRSNSMSDYLIGLKDPLSPLAESFRVLRTNVLFRGVTNDTSVTLVTSAVMGEGKTTVACNLAVAMAQYGSQVILIDADLRRPDVHKYFETENEAGLSSLLLDDAMPLSAVLVDTAVPGLRVLPSGAMPPNPGELLGSTRMRLRLAEMLRLSESIIIDAPPLLALADASILGTLSTGVILVARNGRTRRHLLRQGKRMIDQIGLTILGVVLNDVRSRNDNYHQYYAAAYGNGGSGKGTNKDKGTARIG